MKGLKKWTGVSDDGERKFRGWSDNGHKAFVKFIGEIKEDVANNRYTIWEKAMKECYCDKVTAKYNSDQQGRVRKYEVDRTQVWEL